ncbi:MAG: alpha-amylase family glycosyl hydrolase [Promethearchaeota archaeon]
MKRFAPIIYNLFPRLAGSIDQWHAHLDRIKNMKFNWVYVNPLNYPGFSGSLYSIKEFYKLNPDFSPENAEDPHSWEPLRDFITTCHDQDLNFMMDLVLNHVAIDSPLLSKHPEWFKKKWILTDTAQNIPVHVYEGIEKPEISEGLLETHNLEFKIANPYAIDPADSRKITIWGDLAELDFEASTDLTGLIDFFKEYLTFCLDLGVDGFRCDAAYQIPASSWKSLIQHVKSRKPQSLFLAETLGCTFSQCEHVVSAGFDYICNSSKWWDFTAPWCVEHYNAFRTFAPSISFPESHDTPRLALESNKNREYQVFKYLFASLFSAGIMMPIGYEFGFVRNLHVVQSKPSDWEDPSFDITEEIAKINTFKKNLKILNGDGEIKYYPYDDPNILLLSKANLDYSQTIFLIYNKDWYNPHQIIIQDLELYLDLSTEIFQIFIEGEKQPISNNTINKTLEGNAYLLYLQEK